MPRIKTVQLGENVVMEYPLVKQIVRVISRMSQDDDLGGFHSVETIDAYLSEWVEKGYKLVNTHLVSEIPEGYQMLYILEKLPQQ